MVIRLSLISRIFRLDYYCIVILNFAIMKIFKKHYFFSIFLFCQAVKKLSSFISYEIIAQNQQQQQQPRYQIISSKGFRPGGVREGIF